LRQLGGGQVATGQNGGRVGKSHRAGTVGGGAAAGKQIAVGMAVVAHAM
jgi:hypothetical protein